MTTAVTTPVAPVERLDALDAVRGAAILGILLVNMDGLSGRAFVLPGADATLAFARWDGLAHFLLAFLLEAKFYSLFSFLFGVSFALFVQRAAAKGADAVRLFKRRLVGLLIIGLAHSLLLWYGDILVTYAALGFVLIPFLRRDDRSVLRWAGALLLAPVVIYAVLAVVTIVVNPAVPADPGGSPSIVDIAARRLGSGDYGEVIVANATLTAANALRRLALMFFPRVVGMFLIGLWAGRRNVFGDLDANLPLIRRVFAWGLVIGLPLALFGAAIEGRAADSSMEISRRVTMVWLEMTAKSIAAPVLALGYAAGLGLLFRRAFALRGAFAAAGRLALSNYLLHSAAALVIFYGLGFGLWGTVSRVTAIAGALAFFVGQMVASRVWLRYAAFGPAEWLWRMFTYRRTFPLST